MREQMADFKSLEKPKTSFQEQVERLSQRIEAEAFRTLNKSSQEMTEYASCDPAGEAFPSDSFLWIVLLTKARNVDKALYATLLFIRGVGTELVKHKRFGYSLRPVYAPNRWTEDFWNETRQQLFPWKKELVDLLGQLDGEGGKGDCGSFPQHQP